MKNDGRRMKENRQSCFLDAPAMHREESAEALSVAVCDPILSSAVSLPEPTMHCDENEVARESRRKVAEYTVPTDP